jgi:hypothetical protein
LTTSAENPSHCSSHKPENLVAQNLLASPQRATRIASVSVTPSGSRA